MAITDPTPLYRLRDGIYAPDLLIVAIAELDLFTWLAGRDRATTSELREHFDLDRRAADVMVTYLVALGLLGRDEEKLRLTPLATDHLVAESLLDLRSYFASLRERPACRELVDVLRTGQPAAWASAAAGDDWSTQLADPGFAQRITAAMDARGTFLGPALALSLADLPAQRVLDIGGSSGIYSRALVDGHPSRRAAVFERSPVDAAARTLLDEHGYSDRIEVISGDMFEDPLPMDYDLHLYSHVLHDWGEDQVRHLLDSSFAAMRPGGWLVDHDTHINPEKTGPLAVAEYSVLLMRSTPGKCWSVDELGTFATDAGFVVVDDRPTAADRSAFIARKPAV